MIGSEETVFSHPFRVAIVKWDRFSVDSIARSARAAFGPVELAVFHEARCALAALRAAPVQLGIFGLTLPNMDGLDLLGTVESAIENLLMVGLDCSQKGSLALREVSPTFVSSLSGDEL